MINLRFAIFAGFALYGACIVAPFANRVDRVCTSTGAAKDSPNYSLCTLALSAGKSDAQAAAMIQGR